MFVVPRPTAVTIPPPKRGVPLLLEPLSIDATDVLDDVQPLNWVRSYVPAPVPPEYVPVAKNSFVANGLFGINNDVAGLTKVGVIAIEDKVAVPIVTTTAGLVVVTTLCVTLVSAPADGAGFAIDTIPALPAIEPIPALGLGTLPTVAVVARLLAQPVLAPVVLVQLVTSYKPATTAPITGTVAIA